MLSTPTLRNNCNSVLASTNYLCSAARCNANRTSTLMCPRHMALREVSTDGNLIPQQPALIVSTQTLPTPTMFQYKNVTVKKVLQDSIQTLQSHDVPESELSACHLLSQVLALPSSNGFSSLLQLLDYDIIHPTLSHRRLTCDEAKTYQSMVERRLQHEPIQYILGEWDFYDFTLKCRAPILCPRSETEELVEWVRQDIVDYLKSRPQSYRNNAVQKRVRILDVGSGSGAIGLALARIFPEAEVVAIDLSPEAVALSKENAALLQLNKQESATLKSGDHCRYQVLCCSAKDFTNQHDTSTSACQQFHFEFDFVVSNPPYIPPSDMPTLTRDVIQYESHDALCGGGNDGLNVIRDIIERLPEWTKNAAYGRGDLFMEVDTSHPALIEKWLRSDCNDSDTVNSVYFVESRKDLFGSDRLVKARAIRSND